ncbi:MAG: T9SS type A sorting domain-containing protein, partial [Candidatus Delongbacteria bacterium]|nr:T9SS type A sorting domain-containing protein [Candidatus Delongbacteria bacterium]
DDFYAAGPSSLYTLTWGDPFTVGDQAEVPHRFDLAQNYPNPFNPTTIIEFTLPYPEEIRLEVYNLLGQQVMLLAEGSHSAGAHQVQFDGSGLASGIYLYRLEGDGKVQTRKMAFIR